MVTSTHEPVPRTQQAPGAVQPLHCRPSYLPHRRPPPLLPAKHPSPARPPQPISRTNAWSRTRTTGTPTTRIRRNTHSQLLYHQALSMSPNRLTTHRPRTTSTVSPLALRLTSFVLCVCAVAPLPASHALPVWSSQSPIPWSDPSGRQHNSSSLAPTQLPTLTSCFLLPCLLHYRPKSGPPARDPPRLPPPCQVPLGKQGWNRWAPSQPCRRAPALAAPPPAQARSFA